MLKLRAFRPTGDKIVRIQVHPTHPWIATADASDHVVVWNWEHRQIIYELKAGGVDERRLVGAKLEKLAEGDSELRGKPTEAIRGGSVKQVSFYDDDVRFWQLWRNRSAAAEAPTAANQHLSAFTPPASSTRGRHFLVVCCENKAIFLDLVTMRGRDVPKQDLDNKSLLCMEFLSRSAAGDGPLVAFGGSDGVIRVLSMITWKALLVSGGNDGLLVLWSADIQDSRELVPKLSLKAHDGGVVAVEISRVLGGAPQMITIGVDKTLAIWDTVSFKELRRIKPVQKLACHSVASWRHPRAPSLDILTCVKDSHIWSIEHPTYSAVTRALCELSSLVPPYALAPSKKLRVYCMVAHPLQPHLVATGTNIGVILSEFDPKSLPAAAPLPTPPGGREHPVVYVVEKELKLLNFQLANPSNSSLGNTGSISETRKSRMDTLEPMPVKQTKKHISTPVPHDSYSIISVSSSGKYVSIVWPDVPHFSVYKVSDWSIVHSGTGRLFAWDTCRDRYALLESTVIGLHGGALLGVAYRTSRRISTVGKPSSLSVVYYLSLNGLHGIKLLSIVHSLTSSTLSFLHCDHNIGTWEMWQFLLQLVVFGIADSFLLLHQLLLNAGVTPLDLETRKRKEEQKMREAQARAVAEHGELALITVEAPQAVVQERIPLRPPMLQHAPSVPPFLSMPKQSKMDWEDSILSRDIEERRASEVAVGGGGVSVAVSRFPAEQKRPIGPLVIVGVREGVLWLIDRYMCAHAIALSHPGILCRCLAAYGDAVSAVKRASRLAREHHDDLAQFMLGMGYATEALHLPGISKRLEFELAMQSNDLKRALQCLLTMSNSRDIGQENVGTDVTEILSLAGAKQENLVDAVQGIVKFSKEFLDLIDAADATGQSDVAREALKRLAAAGSVKGALQSQQLRGLALRLANHGELTRLNGLVNNLVMAGQGREAAFAAAVLGDNALMEKAWQDTGMLAEAVLHSHAHGRPSLKNLVQTWNKALQKERENIPSYKSVQSDSAVSVLGALEEPVLTSLADAGKKPPIEILPPGMPSLPASITSKKPPPPQIAQQPNKPLLLEAPSPAPAADAAPPPENAAPALADDASTTPVSDPIVTPSSDPAPSPVTALTPSPEVAAQSTSI
ncbi:hypothetical protein EJ110_NYTH25065 [Nymphaea thermarum]|nr:hypothetical protein EJ110_NYTH25065 [Nymphaea thermarum]